MPAGRPHDGTGDLSYQRRDCMSSLLGRHEWRSAACLSVIVRFLPHHHSIAEARCPTICRRLVRRCAALRARAGLVQGVPARGPARLVDARGGDSDIMSGDLGDGSTGTGFGSYFPKLGSIRLDAGGHEGRNGLHDDHLALRCARDRRGGQCRGRDRGNFENRGAGQHAGVTLERAPYSPHHAALSHARSPLARRASPV